MIIMLFKRYFLKFMFPREGLVNQRGMSAYGSLIIYQLLSKAFTLIYSVNIIYEHTHFAVPSLGMVAISFIAHKTVACYKEVKVNFTRFTSCIFYENCFYFLFILL